MSDSSSPSAPTPPRSQQQETKDFTRGGTMGDPKDSLTASQPEVIRTLPSGPETPEQFRERVTLALAYVKRIVVESDGYPMEHSADAMRTVIANAFLAGYAAA